jgi:hypothetical protein
MINHHHGHLALDSREHAVSLLDALALERAVDVGWTPPRTARTLSPTRLPDIVRGHRGAPWTLGGRRHANSSSP